MKKNTSRRQAADFHLEDDSTLMVGPRIYKVTGQVIGNQVVKGDQTNHFGLSEPTPPRSPKGGVAKKPKSSRKR